MMAYDADQRAVVLFGVVAGLTSTTYNPRETWSLAWNGPAATASWHKENTTASPPARSDGMMAYQASVHRTVLFGGEGSSGLLNDTWVWDGTGKVWENVTPPPALPGQPPTSPRPRTGAVLSQDPSGNLVLFGGRAGGGCLEDTWTWDGAKWHQSAEPGPPARCHASSTYDSVHQRTVLFGGDRNTTAFSDTWTWYDSRWHQESPKTSPPARSEGALAFVPVTGQTVLVGGSLAYVSSSAEETWTWDNSDWTLRTPAQLPPRFAYAGMAYDAQIGRLVLVGAQGQPAGGGGLVVGSDPQGGTSNGTTPNGLAFLYDTWSWDGTKTNTGVDVAKRVSISVAPSSIPADGSSTSTLTVRVTVGYQGIPKATVNVGTDDDVTFSPVIDKGDGSYVTTVKASLTPGLEHITADVSLLGQPWGSATTSLAELAVPCPRPAASSPPRWSDLDPGFGCAGKLLAPLTSARSESADAHMALDASGRILLNEGVALLRRLPDGSPDPSFGKDGIAPIPDPGGARMVTVLPGGKILTAGAHFFRFNSDGSLDKSFGNNGISTSAPIGARLVLQPDGKILALGGNFTFRSLPETLQANNYITMQVGRYTAGGDPDPSFGHDGLSDEYYFDAKGGYSAPRDMALQDDGKIVIAGSQNVSTGRFDYGLHADHAFLRMNADGRGLDPSFNPCGVNPPPCGGRELFRAEGKGGGDIAAILIRDGKILGAGTFAQGRDAAGFGLIRINESDGSLDPTFNACGATAPPPCGGKVFSPTRFDGYEARSKPSFAPPDSGSGETVAVQPDGSIIVTGSGPPGGPDDFLVARYDRDGILATCTDPGYVRTRFGWGAFPLSAAIRPDGRIIAAGFGYTASVNNGLSIAIAQYRGGLPPTPPKTAGIAPALTVREPTATAVPANFAVSLDAPACHPVTVDYSTSDGTAKAGRDYVPRSGTVTFGVGQKTAAITVPVLADGPSDKKPDADESFFVNLANPTAHRLDPTNPQAAAVQDVALPAITLTSARAIGTIVQPPPRSPANAPPLKDSPPPADQPGTPPIAPQVQVVPGYELVLPPVPVVQTEVVTRTVRVIGPRPPVEEAPGAAPAQQVQAQQQSQRQSQQQSALQASVMAERQRQAQAEGARNASGDGKEKPMMATSTRRGGPGAAVVWVGALGLFAMGLLSRRSRSPARASASFRSVPPRAVPAGWPTSRRRAQRHRVRPR